MQVEVAVDVLASPLIASAATLDARVRAAATLASIILALLTLFTTRRAQRLAEDNAAGIGGVRAEIPKAAPEFMLALATAAALVAMSRLFRDTLSFRHWADRDHVVESLFSIAYLGFFCIFLFQVGLVGRRLVKAVPNSWAARRSKKTAESMPTGPAPPP